MPQVRFWEALHALATRLGTNTLTGQTAVIVGASRGLGLMLARELAKAGCKLALCARDANELERARRELVTTGAAVFARPVDATRADQVEDFVHATLRRFGSLDMLITCAAASAVGPLETIGSHHVEQAFEQVFWPAYYPTMAVLPHMRERKAGRVVHVSALEGSSDGTNLMPYSTARSALTGFSTSLRAEVAKDGVSVTAALSSLVTELAARRILRAAAERKAESPLTLGVRLLMAAQSRSMQVPALEPYGHGNAAALHAYPVEDRFPLPATSPSSLLRVSSGGAN
jgi:NAD(P)-dependent dehydrogenase (short-subunit alcohol dehydrogenase family)